MLLDGSIDCARAAREIMTRENIELLIKCLPNHEGLDLPAYMSAGSSGMDLIAAVEKPVTLEPGKRVLIPTGISIAVPEGFEAQVRPRSGLAHRHGIGVLNSPGTIDYDYRGEVHVILTKFGDQPFVIERGLQIAQLVIAPTVKAEIKIVSELDVTIRNHGGFGHTGV